MFRTESEPPRSDSAEPGIASSYSSLIDRLCELCATRPSSESHERCEVTIAGTLFTLIPSVDENGIDGMAYFADVAALPQDQKEVVAMRLLEANLFLMSRDAPSFCLNPQTGHAVLAGCLALHGITPESAHDYLTGLAAIAGAWRESQFMPAGAPPGFSASS